MYRTLKHPTGEHVYAIEKDGEIVLHLQAGAETVIKNVDFIIEKLNREERMVDKEHLFCWLLEEIWQLGCTSNIYQLRQWFFSEDRNQREFRLSGKFGFGFKIRRDGFGLFYFDQYSEDETPESKGWIERHNKELKEWCESIRGE